MERVRGEKMENIELPKHTNSLQIKVDDRVKPYKKLDVIPIPAGATNGDVIKAMFPNIEVKPHMAYGLKNGIKVRVYIDEFSVFDLWFPTRWWNTPYKKEVEE
jgi:hypothetical protein